MMAAAPVPAKVSRLIPHLGSTYDGEVVATARAIGRALVSHGLDWHDFANAVDHGLDRPRSNRDWRNAGDEPVAPLWNELDFHSRVAWLHALDGYHGLSKWEGEFVASIARQRFDRLSQKQILVINRLIARAFSVGVRP